MPFYKFQQLNDSKTMEETMPDYSRNLKSRENKNRATGNNEKPKTVFLYSNNLHLIKTFLYCISIQLIMYLNKNRHHSNINSG